MDAPNALTKPTNYTNDKSFNVKFNDTSFILIISSNSLSIKFILSQVDNTQYYSFEETFTLEQFIKINNIFIVFNSIESMRDSIEKIITNNKYLISQNNNNEMIITLQVPMFEKNINVDIPLKKKKLDQNDLISRLCQQIEKLNNEIKEIKNENENLKNSFEKWKEQDKIEKDQIKLNIEQIKNKLNELDEKNIQNKNLLKQSVIIKNKEEIEFLIYRLKQYNEFKNRNIEFNLLYKGTRDGDESRKFHQLCDGKKNVIVFVQTTKNRRFGGFTSIGYNNYSGSQIDNSAFIFSLDKLKYYNVKQGGTAIYSGEGYGPLFDGDRIVVENKCFTNESWASKKGQYYQTTEHYELNGGESRYLIKEIEVFQII